MKIEVEVKKFVFNSHDDLDLVNVRTRVRIDGRRERGLEEVMIRDSFRSNFDVVWDEMGRKLKKAFKIKDSDDGK